MQSRFLNLLSLHNKFAQAKFSRIRYSLPKATTEILPERFVTEQQLHNNCGSFFLEPIQL